MSRGARRVGGARFHEGPGGILGVVLALPRFRFRRQVRKTALAPGGLLVVALSLLFFGLLGPVGRSGGPQLLLAQETQETQEAPGPTGLAEFAQRPIDLAEVGVSLGGPSAVTATGPLFSLTRATERLGGRLEVASGGYRLDLLGSVFVLGPDSPAIVVGTEILALSQHAVIGEGGLLVPLDALEKTFGRVLEYDFVWSPEIGQLTAVRRRERSLEVRVEVVQLGPVTTVVVEFDQRPRYEIDDRDGVVSVVLRKDRYSADSEVPAVSDSMLQKIELYERSLRLSLAPGTRAESYALDEPFRLVFDIVRGRRAATETGDSGQFGPPIGSSGENPEPRRVAPPRRQPGLRTIVIDPGHGGKETGAIGKSGVQEKRLTLEIARALKNRLEQRFPVTVILTREEDAYLPLETRTAIANQNKADLFISIHLNSSFGSKARGAETYFLSLEASDESAAAAAASENQFEDEGDPLFDLNLMLWDLTQSRHLEESQSFAKRIQEELNEALDLKDRGVKQAPFLVLRGAAMPAVLVELGFLSNPEEEKRLQSPDYRSQLVEALVQAIGRYRSSRLGSSGDADELTPADTSPGDESAPPAAGGPVP